MEDIAIRQAEDDELGAVAGLRWQWVQENNGTPAMTRDRFVAAFVRWARQHTPSHRCIVATRGSAIVGMAWLAIVPRVPTPQAQERASGDVQCVYVVPRERDAGLGRLMITAVLELADQLRLERVTVHSSARAVTAYSRPHTGTGWGRGCCGSWSCGRRRTEYTGWSSRSWPTTTGPGNSMSAWDSR